MAPDRTHEEWSPYITAWRDRRHQASKALETRVEVGRAAAGECARVLVNRFGARRVWLFGSLALHRSAHHRSDIDLAVEGLPPIEYFPALSAIWELLPPGFEIDLVPLEDANPSLVDLIDSEGELLYDRT